MKLKDWFLCVGVSILVLFVVVVVMVGTQAIIVDTGRAIIQK